MKTYVEEFITAAVAGPMDHDRYLELFNKAQLYAFCNEVAVAVAQRFLGEAMSFEDADAVANELYGLYIGEPIEIPQPADSIYLAFDRGEYALDGEDSIDECTRPMLRKILASHFEKYS